MFSRLRDILQLFPSAFFLKRKVEEQSAFTKVLLDELLAPYQENNDGTLQKKDLRRMRDYPWQFVAFFADIFALLRQTPLTHAERRKLTLFASSLCLYDDFFDYDTLSDQQIREIYLTPERFAARTTKEKVFVRLLKEMYAVQSLNPDFESVFLKFYYSQVDSKQQFKNPDLSKEAIRSISFNKGGYALLLSRLLMDNPGSPQEREVVYQLGAWFQLLDDLLDIEKDRRENVKTLMTSAARVEEMEAELRTQTHKTFELLQALDYPDQQKWKAIHLFRTIGTSGWVHLHQLYQLQKQTHGQFVLHHYSDEALRWVETRTSNYWIGLRHWLIK